MWSLGSNNIQSQLVFLPNWIISCLLTQNFIHHFIFHPLSFMTFFYCPAKDFPVWISQPCPLSYHMYTDRPVYHTNVVVDPSKEITFADLNFCFSCPSQTGTFPLIEHHNFLRRMVLAVDHVSGRGSTQHPTALCWLLQKNQYNSEARLQNCNGNLSSSTSLWLLH